MIESYWDLYAAYIDYCVRYNYENDIDPHHYRMEWNHFLPKAVFGDWPIGQYLLLRQHAIASSLQTLAFKRNCMCGHHKKHLPKQLLDLAWPYYREDKRNLLIERSKEKDKNGKSTLSMKALSVIHKEKTQEGKSKHAIKAAKASHKQRDKNGKSIKGVKIANLNNSQRWMCLTTGFITNPGCLSRYQKSKGLSTGPENRVRLS